MQYEDPAETSYDWNNYDGGIDGLEMIFCHQDVWLFQKRVVVRELREDSNIYSPHNGENSEIMCDEDTYIYKW